MQRDSRTRLFRGVLTGETISAERLGPGGRAESGNDHHQEETARLGKAVIVNRCHGRSLGSEKVAVAVRTKSAVGLAGLTHSHK
jgi:hypothetical protein